MKHSSSALIQKNPTPNILSYRGNFGMTFDKPASQIFRQLTEELDSTPKPNHQEGCDKEKIFKEMMGYPKPNGTFHSRTPFPIETKANSIALTDFMGKSKMHFLKKTGFLNVYEECKSATEAKKIIEDRYAFNLHNILQFDTIREYEIKSPTKIKSQMVLPVVETMKIRKKKGNKRVEKIQVILDKCSDALQKKKEQKLPSLDFSKKVEEIHKSTRGGKRRLTHLEKEAIKKELVKNN
jgi:hypothetical protein